jgi:D-beta-D-heptose 7-phosphate kinase/D-beta-D-heptose 1-phosphate adenosyltransferase
MISTLADFRAVPILVVGDVMLDRYWTGSSERLSPEAPVPVVRVGDEAERPGGAANVAVNVAGLEGRAAILGWVGDDADGRLLRTRLADLGVADLLLTDPAVRTVAKLRVLAHRQQMIRLDFERPVPERLAPRLTEAFVRALDDCRAVVLSDYGKGSLADVPTLVARARALGRPVLIDPKGRDYARYRGADALTPNLREFEAVVGAVGGEADLVRRAEELRAALDLGVLVVTRGEDGLSVFERGRPPLHVPADNRREVADVTGAGDTVIATLAAARAAGWPWAEAARIANTAAGLVVGHLGAVAVRLEELRAALGGAGPSADRIVDEETLVARVAAARTRGERVVFTNGCFDLLHAGHVRYLEEARRMGDLLVVAVNDDDSVRALKGEGRPLQPLAARLEILAGLRSVDWVVAFSEPDPERLICRLRPDVLVKGGDYAGRPIAGGRCVEEYGGRVCTVGYVEGYSTSGLVARLRDR